MADESSSDARLIARLAAGDRTVQAELAARYLDFVYTTARRLVGDAHVAEDVTQAVFIILMSKAKKLGPRVVLAGWLYRTTAYVAANALKMRRRRDRHEQRAAVERSEYAMPSHAPTEPEVLRELDAAMLSLGSKHRDVLLLRFFQRRSLAQVGATLNISEEAAKKRVARALDRLRRDLLQRPHASVVAKDLGALLSALPQASAPASLRTLIGHGAVAGPTVQALVRGGTFMMLSKSLTAARLVVLLLAGGAVAVVTFKGSASPAPPAVAKSEGKGIAAAPNDGRVSAPFPQGTIQVLAVGSLADGAWWSPSGDRRVEAPFDRVDMAISPEPGKVARLFVLDTGFVDNENGPPTSTIGIPSSQAQANTKMQNVDGEAVRVLLANVDPKRPATIVIDLATGPWETFARLGPGVRGGGNGSDATLDSIVASQPRGTDVRVHCVPDGDLQALAIDKAGGRHPMWPSQMRGGLLSGGPNAWNVAFHARDIAPDDVTEVVLQRRSFNQHIEVRDVAVDASMRTAPTIEVVAATTQPSTQPSTRPAGTASDGRLP